MGKKQSHPELGQQDHESLYSFQLKNRHQILREKLTWIITGLGLGIAVTAGVIYFAPLTPLSRQDWSSTQSSTDNPFGQGLDYGMRAAELTQSAELKEDWIEVAMLWQNAIDRLKAIPSTSAEHAQAQQKIAEYGRNLKYAESNITTRPSGQPSKTNYWTLGSDRELVLSTQGAPNQIRQVSASCYETLHYANSVVELENGYVKSYDNFDNNLKVLEVGETALSTRNDNRHWSLGSTKDTVIQLQGTPDRSKDFESERFTTLYYGTSFVLFDQDRVIGYMNHDNNLNVSTVPALLSSEAPQAWSLGSTRLEVLQAQEQTPQAVSRRDDSCEEIFHFGNSEVYFKQGLVTGYRNVDRNLKLR